jgi:hypothetical protein
MMQVQMMPLYKLQCGHIFKIINSMNKILVFILLFCCAGAYAQNPVIINQPYDFQKWVRVKDSIRASRGFFPDSLVAPKNWTKKINDTSIVVGRDTLINISNTKKDIDVFLVAGQSNAKGKGDSTLSPRVISGKVLQINTGVISDANDPVGQDIPGSNERSQYGSAWPSFGNTYYTRTSRLICMVPSYKGGTSQCAAADVGNGNWDTTGVLFDSAVARVKNSMTVLSANGYNPIFKGVVWLQGESDGIGIQNGTITQTDYINAFKKMIRKFRVNFGASMPFYIIRIGATTAYVDANWKLIRDAQQTVANADSSTQIVFYNAANFVARGLMQGDGVHINQVGLNEVGQMTANAVLNHNKNIWQPQAGSLYYANTGTVAIAGPPTEDYDLEINTSKNNSHGGMKILNSNNGTGAFSAIKLYTDAGNSGFIFASSSTNTVYGPNIFTIYSAFSGGLRLGANTGDIVFGQLAQGNAGNSYARYVVGSGNYLYNTATDVPANGKFQINSTSWFNGLMKLNSVAAPPSTYNVLVHGLSDSGTYQVPLSGLSAVTRLEGLLYDKSTWSNLSDFTQRGSFTPTPSAGAIVMSGGTNDFTKTLDLDTTMRERYVMHLEQKVGSINSTSDGIGIGTRSTNAYANFGVSAILITNNTGNQGKILLFDVYANTVIATSSSALSFSTNDVIALDFERDRLGIKAIAYNKTTGSGQISVSYNYSLFESPSHVLPNVGTFSVFNVGGNNSMTALTITSKETKNAPFCLSGDSKLWYYAGDVSLGMMLDRVFRPTNIHGGPGDDLDQMLAAEDDIINQSPVNVAVTCGSNDIGHGFTVSQTFTKYKQYVSRLTNAGITVYHLLPLYQPSIITELDALSDSIRAYYPSAYIIDCRTPMRQCSSCFVSSSDNVHPNALTQLLLYNTIINSGKLGSYYKTPIVASLGYTPIGSASDSLLVKRNDAIYAIPQSAVAAKNFFNTDLSATGNRSHNFKGFNLTVDSLKDYKLFSKGSFFGTPVRSSYQVLPNTPSSGLLITYAFSKTDLSGDSVSVYLSGTPNNIDLGAADISNNHNSVVRVSNSGTGKSNIMLQTDSLSASMQPRSTYDSLVVVGTYNSGTKTNPIGKASLSDVRGYKIYNALLSQSGTSDPTATVLGGNQVGAIVWTRAGLGAYTGTLSGAFTTAKTFILVGQNADGITANCFRSDANTVTLKTYLTLTGGSTDVFTDLSLEIRVYP